jgi:hypothetical protein
LTTRPTDYYGFEPALNAVCSTLDTPESWIGDGHYGTHANLLLAAQAGVVLYASSARAAASAAEKAKPAPADSAQLASPIEPAITTPPAAPARLSHADFHHNVERDTLICAAGQELRHIGTYPTDNGQRHYQLYGRSDCGDCTLKSRCTETRGRRVKLINDTALPPARANIEAASVAPGAPSSTTPDLGVLIQAHEARMREVGPNVMRFRAQTVEPVNSQLKQHGLQRFHVRGLARCSVVLTLGCIAHNLMKWNTREAARAMSIAA